MDAFFCLNSNLTSIGISPGDTVAIFYKNELCFEAVIKLDENNRYILQPLNNDPGYPSIDEYFCSFGQYLQSVSEILDVDEPLGFVDIFLRTSDGDKKSFEEFLPIFISLVKILSVWHSPANVWM